VNNFSARMVSLPQLFDRAMYVVKPSILQTVPCSIPVHDALTQKRRWCSVNCHRAKLCTGGVAHYGPSSDIEKRRVGKGKIL
jgi:hypothetical protein